MFGMSAEIQVPRMERCERCKGAGSEPGSGPSDLPHLPRPRRNPLPAELPFHPPHLQHLQRLAARSSAIPAPNATATATGRCSAS